MVRKQKRKTDRDKTSWYYFKSH